MNWQGTRVLVTGAGGFIGSHLTERLVALGTETRAFVHYNANSSAGWLDSSPARGEVEVFFGDVQDPDSLREALRGVSVVFHLAALIAIPYSYQAPASYIRTNIEGTLNVLRASLNAGAGLVVHTSTSEVYGTARYVPIDENHPLQGQSPYSASKIGADKMAEAFHLSFGLPIVTIRPFNTYGPRQSARAVIPTIITQALTQSEVHLGSLDPTRDFTYVTDTAEGFVLGAEASEAVGRVINLGSGRDISIGDLAQRVLAQLGKDLPVVSDAERSRPAPSEVERLLSDNRQAETLMGWRPQVPLDQGLEQTIAWVTQNIDRYRGGSYTV
jgi:NAD dependent epimerase/dehydratase